MNDRITMQPDICHGTLCIRGLRYPVESVLEWLAAGMSIEDVLADDEVLEREDILAVLDFAARVSHINRIEPIGQMAAWNFSSMRFAATGSRLADKPRR